MLKIKFNYGYHIVGERRGGKVDVSLRAGGFRSLEWLGLIDSERARQIENPTRVKIKAAYWCDDAIGYKWHELAAGEFIQRCAVNDSVVYGVYQAKIKVVTSPHTDDDTKPSEIDES